MWGLQWFGVCNGLGFAIVWGLQWFGVSGLRWGEDGSDEPWSCVSSRWWASILVLGQLDPGVSGFESHGASRQLASSAALPGRIIHLLVGLTCASTRQGKPHASHCRPEPSFTSSLHGSRITPPLHMANDAHILPTHTLPTPTTVAHLHRCHAPLHLLSALYTYSAPSHTRQACHMHSPFAHSPRPPKSEA